MEGRREKPLEHFIGARCAVEPRVWMRCRGDLYAKARPWSCAGSKMARLEICLPRILSPVYCLHLCCLHIVSFVFCRLFFGGSQPSFASTRRTFRWAFRIYILSAVLSPAIHTPCRPNSQRSSTKDIRHRRPRTTCASKISLQPPTCLTAVAPRQKQAHEAQVHPTAPALTRSLARGCRDSSYPREKDELRKMNCVKINYELRLYQLYRG